MNEFIEYMGAKVHHPLTVTWLRLGLYALVLYHIVFMAFPLTDLLWAEHSLVLPLSFPNTWVNRFVMLLHQPEYARLYPLFIALPIVGIGLYVWRGYQRLSAVLVYIGFIVLFNRVIPYMNGGNYLMHIYLFYIIFMAERSPSDARWSFFSNLLTNLGLWAFRIQLLIVYVFTLAYKLGGTAWIDGSAVFIITHIDEFTLPWFETYVASIKPLMMIANYGALLYFILFPILIWVKRWKLRLLLVGTIFHLCLGLILGVMDFSLMMIVAYISFLEEDQIQSIKNLLPSKKRALMHP